MEIKKGQWFKGKDFELHYVNEEWILTLNQLGEKVVLPLEYMVGIHFAVQDSYFSRAYYGNTVDIDAVINWMNEWEQLKGTSIPIRFDEDFRAKDHKKNHKWYHFWRSKASAASPKVGNSSNPS